MNRVHEFTSRRRFITQTLAAGGMAAAPLRRVASAAESTPGTGALNVKNLGATGNGVTLDTPALQKAIDHCADAGGGTVWFPAGRYLSGTLFLRSRVTLHLEAGATLLGSRDLAHYPSAIPVFRSFTDNYTERSLLYAERAEQIAIEGRGVIDGQGAAFKRGFKGRPFLLRIIGCRDVFVQGITLRDSPMWVQHYLACDGVRIDGITVVSKCNSNNDGIDIDGCQRVRISHCDLRSGDDALVLKSTFERPCRQVVVDNCILNSDCNAFKLGTESNGGFEDILVSNCAIYDTHLAGIALETVDGGALDGVDISNVTMRNVGAPIFVRLGNRARPYQRDMAGPGIGTLRNICIHHVQATGAGRIGCSITGLPGHPVENVTLGDLHLQFAGGGKPQDAQRQPPEKPEAYPEFGMFGTLPAYGFYCRHARNLAFQNVSVEAAAPDERPSFMGEDVDALRLSGWRAETASSGAPVVRLEDVRHAAIHGCAAPEKTGPWLRVGGKTSARIRLFGNDLSAAAAAVETAPETPPGAVVMTGSGGKTP